MNLAGCARLLSEGVVNRGQGIAKNRFLKALMGVIVPMFR
jgi:hypothetical protein